MVSNLLNLPNLPFKSIKNAIRNNSHFRPGLLPLGPGLALSGSKDKSHVGSEAEDERGVISLYHDMYIFIFFTLSAAIRYGKGGFVC